MVPCGLFFAPETSCNKFLIDVKNSVVIVIDVFSIRYSIVVIVNIVYLRLKKTKGHLASVPNCLIEAVVICISIVSVIVIIYTICA